MPYDITVDHLSRTIVVTGTGSGTTADTLRLIADHQETFRSHPGFHLLYDSTQLQVVSSPTDMMAVANALFEEARVSFRKIAIVVPDTRIELARIFTALADPYGISANVFTDVGDARRWLGIDILRGT
ncbi:MAG: STAS/SEC14 domain-containing protein [Longimicrobiales bacterium]